MKKNTLPLVIATVIILFLFTGCDKYHRDRYTGTWDFVTERTFYMEGEDFISPIEVKRDTVYYTGKICNGNLENDLIIQYTDSNKVSAWIEIKGKRKEQIGLYTGLGLYIGKYSSGYIEDDNKMYLCLYYGLYSPIEGTYDRRVENISGTKKGKR